MAGRHGTRGQAKRAAAQAAKTKEPKKQKATYYGVVMCNGDVQTFTSENDKNDFVADYEDNITDSKEFTTKKAMEEWKKTKEKCATPSPKSATKKINDTEMLKMSPGDDDKVKRCIVKIENKRPTDTIDLYWKTGTRSKAACVVIRFLQASKFSQMHNSMITDLDVVEN